MAGGSIAHVGKVHLRAFIRNPKVRVVKGFAPAMPPFDLGKQELSALVAYAEAQGGDAASTTVKPQREDVMSYAHPDPASFGHDLAP